MKSIMPTLLILVVLITATAAQEPFDGNTLISVRDSDETRLIDINYNTVHSWHGASFPTEVAYLLPDMSLLRPTVAPNLTWGIGGRGGRIQKIDVNDNVVWDFLVSDSLFLQHHDIEPMPNGNVLVIAWERKFAAEAIAAGRQSLPSPELWPTAIFEYEQVGLTEANIVWEWHLWDHLVQDADSTKANYGVVADHPELVDINYPRARQSSFDHANAIDYNSVLDQIVYTARATSEVYVIDHSTTTAEAAGHTGGRMGKGGDILYRWGNPGVYHRGTASDRHIFSAHGSVWIDCGLPGEGGILVFNNGFRPGPAPDFSTVVEFKPPMDADGNYIIEPDQPYGPISPTWVYKDRPDFYSRNKGGAYRLPNGNTLITESNDNYIFEVTPSGQKVWAYEPTNEVHRAQRYWPPQPLVADFDIKPRSCPNPFNIKWLANDGNGNGIPKKGGKIPAAIVGSQCFDVTQIDLSTLELEGIKPLKSRYEDVTAPAGDETCACTTDGPDGFTDLTLKFSRLALANVLGTVGNSAVVMLSITGSMLDGTPFEASDCVTILSKDPIPISFSGADAVVLYPAVPNPFNPITRISYEIAERMSVSLTVYDVQGRSVKRLVQAVQDLGIYDTEWDGTNESGENVSSGIYESVLKLVES